MSYGIYRKIDSHLMCIAVSSNYAEVKDLCARINNLRGYMSTVTTSPMVRKFRGEKALYPSTDVLRDVIERKELALVPHA